MKIFIAGASGAIGSRLVPLLVSAGHRVTGTARRAEKLGDLRALGAEAVILDGLDREAILRAVTSAQPEVVIQQMTALSSFRSTRNFDKDFELTNRLRTEGTQFLLEAALAAGAKKFIAQSYTGWPNERIGSRTKTEDDPLDTRAPKNSSQTLAAIRSLETMVTAAQNISGIVLRYGGFYGPGTSLGADGVMTEMVRKRKLPLVGNGGGVWSFLHIDDAASATKLAVDRDATGIYNIVDDEPAEVRIWLPDLAEALGAKPPRHVPVWLARFAIGGMGVAMMTQIRGSSNAKAKRALNWQPKYASWREGFRNGI